MDLRTFIERGGQRLSKQHPEVIRLARVVKASPYTLYMVALGHKTFGIRKATALAQATGFQVEAQAVCANYPVMSASHRKMG
jgi:hypothetical protein